MRNVAWVALGIVIGFLLGGIAPQVELARVELQLREARDALESAPSRSGFGAIVPGFDRAMRGPEGEPMAIPPQPAPPGESDDAPLVVWDGPDPGFADGGVGQVAADRDVVLDHFETVVDAQRMRRMQSRAALIEQGELDDASVAEVDAAIERMNEALVPYAEELMLLTLGGQDLDPADMLGLTHDVTGILHEAQTSIDRLIGEHKGEVDEEARMVWNHLDIERFRPAVRAMQQDIANAEAAR